MQNCDNFVIARALSEAIHILFLDCFGDESPYNDGTNELLCANLRFALAMTEKWHGLFETLRNDEITHSL